MPPQSRRPFWLRAICAIDRLAGRPSAPPHPSRRQQGTLELAQEMANHASPRTTKLYDRRGDKITQDAVERIRIE